MRHLVGTAIFGAAIPLGRIGAFALLALGLACWLARDQAATELVIAIVLYNCGVLIMLGPAGVLTGMTGVLLWPAVALHAAVAIWSLMIRRQCLG
jgi:hypothetical protein